MLPSNDIQYITFCGNAFIQNNVLQYTLFTERPLCMIGCKWKLNGNASETLMEWGNQIKNNATHQYGR